MEDTITDTIIRKRNEAEEAVLTDILFQILKRTPTKEDFKDLTKFIPEGATGVYWLAYKNMKLGKLEFQMDFTRLVFTWEFFPLTGKDFLDPATNAEGTKATF